MFFSKKLQKFKNLRHCFFSRKDGVSQGIYESLNCGIGSYDKKENVLKNLELVSEKIGCKKDLLITLNQKHSNKVIYFKNEIDVKNKLHGDAIISKVKNSNHFFKKKEEDLKKEMERYIKEKTTIT